VVPGRGRATSFIRGDFDSADDFVSATRRLIADKKLAPVEDATEDEEEEDNGEGEG
jgi:hypothetical protein